MMIMFLKIFLLFICNFENSNIHFLRNVSVARNSDDNENISNGDNPSDNETVIQEIITLDKFIIKKNPLVKFSEQLVTKFSKIRDEFKDKIDLSNYLKFMQYSQKLTAELMLDPIKKDPNFRPIEGEIFKYLDKIEKISKRKISIEEYSVEISQEIKAAQQELEKGLSKLLSTSIESSYSRPTNNFVDINEPQKQEITSSDSNFDIGSVVDKNFSDSDRKSFSETMHQSHVGKNKPVSYKKSKGRLIPRTITETQMAERKNWLVLSTDKKGYFCLPCALIFNGQNNSRNKFPGSKFGILVSKPLVNFNSLTGHNGLLDTHPSSSYHCFAVNAYNSLRLGQTIEDFIKSK